MEKRKVKLYISLTSAALAALCVLAVVWSLARAERKRYQAEHEEQVRSQLLATKTRLEDTTNSRLSLIQGLGAYISGVNPYIYREEFNTLARLIIVQQSGVRGIFYQDQEVDLFYPEAGKPANLKSAIGKQGVATEAIKNKTVVLGGWMEWEQENQVLIGLSPVFQKPDNQKERYWGLAGILIDKNTLFKEAENTLLKAATNNSKSLLYAVRGKSKKEKILFGDAKIFEGKPVILDVKLPNDTWELAAIPVGGWPRNAPISGKLWLAGLMLMFVVGGLVFVVVYLVVISKVEESLDIEAILSRIDAILSRVLLLVEKIRRRLGMKKELGEVEEDMANRFNSPELTGGDLIDKSSEVKDNPTELPKE